MLGVRIQRTGDDPQASATILSRAPRGLMRTVEGEARRHGEESVTEIKTVHRSGPATTDTTTRVITGNFRGSYQAQSLSTSREALVYVGGLRAGAKGRALSYMITHEEPTQIRQGNTVRVSKPRPPGGAIKTVLERREPKLLERVDAAVERQLAGAA